MTEADQAIATPDDDSVRRARVSETKERALGQLRSNGILLAFIALIALVALSAVTFFGESLSAEFDTIATSVGSAN